MLKNSAGNSVIRKTNMNLYKATWNEMNELVEISHITNEDWFAMLRICSKSNREMLWKKAKYNNEWNSQEHTTKIQEALETFKIGNKITESRRRPEPSSVKFYNILSTTRTHSGEKDIENYCWWPLDNAAPIWQP